MKKPTYTATYDDNGAIIYKNRPQGNLIGELPLGARPNVFGEEGDPWDGARGVTASGRAFTIRRDTAQQPIAEHCKPAGSVSRAGAGKEAHTPLPWSVSGSFDDFAIIGTSPAGGGVVVCYLANWGDFRGKAQFKQNLAADAAFIVRAVNSRSTLLAVLKDCLDTFSGATEYLNGCSTRDMADKIRAALAAATEGEGAQ